MERVDVPVLDRNKGTALTLLYGCTIFLSAFLLFQVQPLIGKTLLPWFGGTAAVWSTCLLFFQVLLLLGYMYAHWTTKFLAPKYQASLHIALLVSSIAVLPIRPDAAWKPTGSEDPTILIVGLMAMTIGLPYFLLSSTGPLLQALFAREKSGAVPYRLFALSNLGSMLGLLSYPVIFEPGMTISAMSAGWSIAYAVFALLCAALAWRGRHRPASARTHRHGEARNRPNARTLLLWICLAACPTVLLMAVTSHLTQNVAPVPFLWILPLALYLATFILCFEGGHWYRRGWTLPFFILAVGLMSYDLLHPLTRNGVWAPIALYCAGLFVSGMMCHGELARTKPDPEYLTSFYLMIALGGAVGGALVAIVAPRIFNSNYELPIAIIATALLVVTLVGSGQADSFARSRSHRLWSGTGAAAVAVIAIFAAVGTVNANSQYRVLVRNFYGTLNVADTSAQGPKERQLVHGSILHGSQYLDSERRRWPTTYYGENSGAGMAVMATRREGLPQRVGVIGLGTGTMAAYGRSGDYYRFYEINPLVAQLARSEFTFLADSAAQVETAMGDARLSLERESPQQFDALIVDAFSGDSIPVHLLTREAFAVYLKHMKPDGILAVHISNRNLDLAPVVKRASDYYGKEARLVEAEENGERGWSGSSWVLISGRPDIFDANELKEHVRKLDVNVEIRPWTDDYSSIYTIMR